MRSSLKSKPSEKPILIPATIEGSVVDQIQSDPVSTVKKADPIDWKLILNQTISFLKTRDGIGLVLLGIGFLMVFQHLVRSLPEYWFMPDSYYSHGPLVPFLAAYIIWDRRELIAKVPNISTKSSEVISWTALLLIFPLTYLVYIASRTDLLTILTVSFILVLILGSVAFFGTRKTMIAMPGILYTFLAFPFGRGFLDQMTNKLGLLSTSMAMAFLKLLGENPYRLDTSQIIVGHYSLYVAVACAGMGMSLSVFAFAVLFSLIGHLNWWKSLAMIISSLAIVVPINGFRIALIAVVGDHYGDSAAAAFHDYSGYISLIILFFILMKMTRLLGWK